MTSTDLKPAVLSDSDRANKLDSCGWAKDWSWQQIEAVSRYFHPFRAAKGAVIFTEGAQESYMGVVISGNLSILKEDARGRRKSLAVLGAGRMFGELSLIDHAPRSAAAICKDPCEIFLFAKQDFERLVSENPQLAVQLLLKVSRLISQRLRQASGKLVDFLEG